MTDREVALPRVGVPPGPRGRRLRSNVGGRPRAHEPRPSPRVRLLLVGPLPPPIGGVETFTQALLESSALRAFDVQHCDITKKRPRASQGRFDPANFVWAARHVMRLRRQLSRFRPHAVYLPISGTWSGALRDLVLAAIARRSGAWVVGHLHGGRFARVLAHRGPLAGPVRNGLRQFDRILVLGERWRTLLLDYGLTQPIDLCPSTYRREAAERARRFTRGFDRDGPLRVLFVGQIGQHKGVHDLLSAVEHVHSRGVPIRLTLVGPAETPGSLDAMVERRARLGLDPIAAFTGALDGEALYEQFIANDLFVLPSYAEGLPAVLYEAGLFQLPVIATPVGSIPDLIVPECNGLLVEPGDVDGLVEAITRLAGDPALCRRLASRLAGDVVCYEPERVSARVVSAIQATLRPS